MATIKEVPTRAGRFERIGAHTHMKGYKSCWRRRSRGAEARKENGREEAKTREEGEDETLNTDS